MKIKHTLILIAGVALCALAAPLTRAQCPQICDSHSNTAIGNGAGVGFQQNVAVGALALQAASVGAPGNNVAVGFAALANSTDPNEDTAVGAGAGQFNTGSDNTGVGYEALYGVQGSSTGSNNAALGSYALGSLSSGAGNVAVGAAALTAVTTGSDNVAIGGSSLFNNTANNNTAVGFQSLTSNSSGTANVAIGYNSLYTNTTGSNNTGTGYQALYSNTIGGSNTASGYDALYFNASGNFNTAYGRGSLYQNTTASNNTAIGYRALNSNKTGTENTATGVGALQQSTANYNTATGYQALNKTTTGHDNTAIGHQALQSNNIGYSNVALGQYALQLNTSGVNNIAVGGLAGFNITTGSNNIDIGNQGLGFESNVIRIGTPGTHTAALISGIYNVAVSGLAVVIGSSGQLGTTASSARYKENIKPMDEASEAILSLEPVTFRYKHDLDPKGILQFGLVAEQVEKVDPELVARDSDGNPYSVRYEAVNAMLLNEFLKEHHKVESLEQAIAEQQKQIKVLTASLQKVSDQVELSKPGRTVMVNDPGKN